LADKTLDVKGTLEVAASAAFDVSLSTTGTIKLDGGVVDMQGSIKLNASNPANSFTGETPTFGTNVKFGPTANADLGAGTATQVNALFDAGIARVASSAALSVATSSLSSLTGWTAGKTLVLTGANTLSGAVDLSTVTGKVVVGSTGSIVAAGNNITAGTTAGDITVLTGGSITATTAALAGKIVFDGGTLSLSDDSGEIAATVDLSAGTVVAASGTPTLALAAAYTGKIGTISAVDQIPLEITGPTAISIGTLTAITTSGGVALTIPSGATATIDTVDISTGSNAITLTGTDSGSTFIVSEVTGGPVEAAATFTKLRLPAGGLTVGEGAELSHAATPTTTFAPGVYTPDGTVEVSAGGVHSIGTGLALTGDDAKISSTIAGYGGVSTTAAVTLLDKISGGTVEISDAVDLTSISANVTFNNATTLEFADSFDTADGYDVTFNGPVVFNDDVTVTGTEALTLLGNSKLLGSGKTITAATGSVVVGGTVNGATNTVTLTKATLTTENESSGHAITLNGETGVIELAWDTAGGKLALAKEGTIVTVGTGKVLVGARASRSAARTPPSLPTWAAVLPGYPLRRPKPPLPSPK
jgi:fibronectin-binding autotransporter adhesin